MDENNQSVNIDTRKVIKISRKKFVIVTVVVAVLILIFLGIFSSGIFLTRFDDGKLENIDTSAIPPILQDSTTGSESTKSMAPDYYNRYQEPSINDTREFLKTSFYANIKTRNVPDVITDVKNIIKGADGRIDNIYSSEKGGQISFVVAKSKFEAFKDEIENITHKKLYTESTSSENLLSQKQSIEEQTTNIVNTLENLKSQKDALGVKHAQTVSSINKELTRIRAELVTVRKIISITMIADTTALRNQEASLVAQETAQKKLLNTENSSYSTQNQNLENSIKNSNDNLTNINKVDSQFTDNIETVSGTISVSWVSLWEMAKIFSPIHPTLIIIILVIAIGFYLKRKGHIPRVVLQ